MCNDKEMQCVHSQCQNHRNTTSQYHDNHKVASPAAKQLIDSPLCKKWHVNSID